MMDARKGLEFAARIIDGAAKRGVKECAVFMDGQEESNLSWRDGRLEETSGSQMATLSVKLYRDGRHTRQSTTDFRESAIGPFLDDAVAFLDIQPADPWRTLPDPGLQWASDIDLGTLDPGYASRDPADRRSAARETYDLARGQDPAIVEAVAWSYESHDMITALFSTGFSGQLEQTWFNLGCSVTMLEPGGNRPSSWYGSPSRLASGLEDPGRIAEEAVKRCGDMIGQSKAAGGTLDIVIRNEEASWPIGFIEQGISALSIDRKTTIYAGMRGKAIASPLLTLREDPFLPGGMNCRRFDGDGFPALRRDLVYGGVLQDYLVDWYYGRKLGLRPNSGETSNLVVEPGKESPQSLIGGVDEGVYVTGYNGGNANPVTGDFSIGISGFLIESGKLGRPVNEMVMSGNYRDLWFALDGVGNDPFTRSSVVCPTLRFRRLNIA
jgi:PmbA protein